MEEPGNKMEEIYALPPRLKYTESWLHLKGKKGFSEYWTVLKGTYMFFFKDQNTHAKEQYEGYIGIDVQQTNCYAKKNSKTELIMEMGKKKFHLKAQDDVLRDRWVYAINLVNRADAPGPLPGDPDFKEVIDATPTPGEMQPRGTRTSIVRIPTSNNPRSELCASLPGTLDEGETLNENETPDEEETPNGEELLSEEDKQRVYDPVFLFPNWYYPNMSRNEAERIMFEQSPGSYLLRDSNKSRSLYALTIKDIGAMKHHRMWVNETNGKCYFETTPDIILPNLLQAVDKLMENTYKYLEARPVCIENRRSGDGEESTHGAELPRKVIKSTPENGYISPGSVSPQSQHDPFSYPSSPEGQMAAPFNQKKKAHSLPGYPMNQRQMPRMPQYENHRIIVRHGRPSDTMQPIFAGENSAQVTNANSDGDAPPPLPIKKKSLRRTDFSDHTYENVPFVYYNIECSHYDSPVIHRS